MHSVLSRARSDLLKGQRDDPVLKINKGPEEFTSRV